MMTDWYKETKKALRNDEKIQRSYHLELNDHEGFITLTDERIIFIRVNGFLRKSYQITLDRPYNEILELNKVNSHSFEIIYSDGDKYNFKTIGIPAIHIVTSINYYKRDAFQVLIENPRVKSSELHTQPGLN
jgi:hypothetical protein